MTHFAGWISPQVMQTLGWALVHFLWQGLALAALVSIAMTLCRSAAARYAIGVAALVLMLAAPVATFFAIWPSDRGSAILAPESFSTLASPARQLANAASNNELLTAAKTTPLSSHPDALLWFVEAWFAGVIILSLRTAGGVLLIERMRRKDAKPVSSRIRQICLAVQWRLRLMRAIQYCESRLLDAPAVIGWIRPAVLLPVTALTGLTDEQLQAVIAHELAHVRRFDNFVNVFQIVVETLLFYHPAVWWVSKRIRAERENCCDDAALSVCGDRMQYARALATMAELRPAPTLAMAANRGPLAARVARLLGAANRRSSARNAGIAASFILLAGAAIAANALFGIAHTALASVLPPPYSLRTGPPAPLETRTNSSPLSGPSAASRLPAATAPNSSAQPASVNMPAPASASQEQKQDQQQKSQGNNGPAEKTSYIDAMKAVGLENLSAEQLIALKIQGVTPEYVRALRDLGLKPDVNELIGMKVQGVTPEYIRDMRAAGVNLDTNKLVGMRVQGITPQYVRALHDLGITPNGDELIGLKVQGVTPEYIKQMGELGIPAKVDEMIGMRVQGVTPEYVKQMHALGVDTNAEHVIALRVQGVTPEYIRDMHDLGLASGTDQIIGMRVQGVTPEYVRDMRALGLNATANQIIGMKVQGVTPEYVKALRATGLPDFKNDPDSYIAARVQGITPEFIAEAQKHGFKNLDLHKLIALKNAGIF